MGWVVEVHDAFKAEYDAFAQEVQNAIASRVILLMEFGPNLGRPYCDTLSGSHHTNMKELRCDADGGVWRIAFAFDPARKAILLTAGDKAGANQKRFYKQLIKTADTRLDEHLKKLKGQDDGN